VTSLSALQALTAFELTELSVVGSFGSLSNPFGSAFSIGLSTKPTIIVLYNQSGQSTTSGDTLKDTANNFVPIGTAIDTNGNTVLTATLKSSSGGLVGFQSAPPSGLNLSGVPPATLTSFFTPTLTDSNGGSVFATTLFDQNGGIVLSIALTDSKGRATTFYSQIDSLGNAVDSTTQSNQNTSFTDLNGVNVAVTVETDQFGNPIDLATLTNASGQVVQYETQSPSVDNINLLSTSNPVGPQNPQPGPFDNQGNQIANLTFYTPAGNTVDNVTLYNGFGVGTQFYSEFDGAGNDTQAITLTATAPTASHRFTAFSSNPNLVAPPVSVLPSAITPFTPTSPSVLSNSNGTNLQAFNLFSSLGLTFNPYALLSLFLPSSSFSFLI
jgi:hypothetical protein